MLSKNLRYLKNGPCENRVVFDITSDNFGGPKLDSAFLSVLIYLGYVLPAGFSKFQIFSAFENVQKMAFELFSKSQVFGKIKKVATRIQIANQTRKSLFKTIFETFGTS